MSTSPDDILDAAATAAAEGVAAATGDGQSAVAMDPLKQIQVADKLASRAALAGTNPQGGPRSGWGCLRPGQANLPGQI